MDDQQKQHLIDLPKTLAGAIATPLAALLTSRFGVAGTMVGLALSAVIVTIIVDTLKVYLARVPEAVTSIPGGFKKKSALGRFLGRVRSPFSKLASLPPPRRRSILMRSLIGGVIVFITGLVIVTGVELSVGKNLSCWVWDDCYTESSADGETASEAGGQPSIFIASNGISAGAPQVTPPVSQQPPAPSPPPPPRVALTPPAFKSSWGNGSRPSVSQQPTSASPSAQHSSPSTEYQQSEYQQQSGSEPQGEYQQRSEYDQQAEYQQQSPTSNPESEQQSLPSSSETQQPGDSEQQSPTASDGADEAGWSW